MMCQRLTQTSSNVSCFFQIGNHRSMSSIGKRASRSNFHRDRYKYWLPIQTRWKDNDMYGHVNNTEYYSYFDTVINHFLIKKANIDPLRSNSIGLCVESKCTFFSPIQYPSMAEVGLVVLNRGTTSLKYEVGIFCEGDDYACATGYFVHVFVDEKTRKPVPLSLEINEAARKILVDCLEDAAQ